MRSFWVAIAVFVLAAGAVFFVSRRPVNVPSSTQRERSAEQKAQDLAQARQQAMSAKMRSADEQGTDGSSLPGPVSIPMKPEEKAGQQPSAAPASAPTVPLAMGDLVAQTATVSATVYVRDREGKDVARGVGFLIASDILVTAGKMVTGAHAVEVHIGSAGMQAALGTIAEDSARDLVLVKLSQPVPQVQALRLSTSEPTVGQNVAVIARGTGPEPLVSAGTLAAVADDPTLGRVLTLSVSGSPLSTGAAVVNSAGAVIGVVSEPVLLAKGPMAVLASEGLAAIPRHALTPFGMYASAKAKPGETGPSTPTPAGGPGAAASGGDAKITKRDDGSILVDDRFVMKGDGTKDKPYELTWEQLISAQDTYDPRSGKKVLPGRVTMLDGKYVRVTGYIAFPLYVDQPTELLSMLNQWDGCCIGVPPTPYDAIEVKLTGTVTKDQKLTTYGVVEGKLSVKPYLVGEWLVGLYLMDEAKLTTKQFGGFGS